MQKAALGAVVAVIKTMLNLLLGLFLLLFSVTSNAAVLPTERADALFHSYSGGGIDITGPAILVRKSVGDSVSISAKHYVDTISSASIDVEVILGASTYEEERVENAFSVDLLNEKTLMSLSYTNSEENDFSADTVSFGISQDMFGDLTTVALGYAHGENEIRSTTESDFLDFSTSDSFTLSLSQVITKNWIASLSYQNITDQGYLQNPYRRYRFVNGSSYTLLPEKYPRTRTSNAIAVRSRYFLPYRAALHAEFRVFEDSWGITATNFEIGYTQPLFEDWIFETHLRTYAQTKAFFYKDLFPFIDPETFYGRDKELSTFNNSTIGFGISYEFAKGEGGTIDKASVNFKYDYIQFNYEDFRDARQTSFDAGTEPLYQFDASIMQLFLSVWF